MTDARSSLRSLVAAILPLDAREEADVADTLAWIDSGAPLWRTAKPATPPKHLVSSSMLVDGKHVLLVDHVNAELWLPTGGHVEPGEHPWATVRREAREELGIECDPEPSTPLFLTVTQTVGRTAGHTDVCVAIKEREVVSHVGFSSVTIGRKVGRWFGLGPLGVRRDQRRQGIGERLAYTGLDALRAREAGGCVVLGDPAYYARFGFVSDPRLTLLGVPGEYVQADPPPLGGLG